MLPHSTASVPHQHHLAKRIPFRRRFTGRDLRSVPDRIAQLPEPSQGDVFDDGFGEAHFHLRHVAFTTFSSFPDFLSITRIHIK